MNFVKTLGILKHFMMMQMRHYVECKKTRN